jgi:hypothetical protein
MKHDLIFAFALLCAWVPCAWAWYRTDREHDRRDAKPHRSLR